MVNLQVTVILSINRNNTIKRAFYDNPVLPRQWPNMFHSHIIDDDPRCAPWNRAFFRYLHANNTWDKRYRSKGKSEFLHFIGFYPKIVLFKNSINKRLLLRTFQRNFNTLVHEQICPIFWYFLPHIERISLAPDDTAPVTYFIAMEPFHISFVPAFPFLNFGIKTLIDRCET